MKNEQGNVFKPILIIVAVVIVLFIFFGGERGYELSVINREEVAISQLRLAIAQSRYDGSGTMTQDDFNTLGKLVKNANKSNQWFGGYKSICYGVLADTSDKNVTIVSDGTYVATFTTIEKQKGKTFSGRKTYLIDYSFEPKSFQGYKFLVIGN